MSLTRRDFMKLFGVTVASTLLTRCSRIVPEVPAQTCYEPIAPTDLPPTLSSIPARERLRLGWLRFGELSQKTIAEENADNALGQQMTADHRAALDELVASGEISVSVADLVQESYEAAVYHVWRLNVPITCYEPMIVDYAPSSADVLVKQSEVLTQIAAQGTIDPATLASAQSALEHDLAFYDLNDEEVEALYDRLLRESQVGGQRVPSFEELELELTPEAKDAAHFILDLLTGK
ncbi:MAG: hypothetical protein HY869_14080 [Chloroflexi bacterium]|nr:hypothetical protein [Chloroflexota bacterium]